MKKRRVCITGIGIVSPLGVCRESSWSAVLAGKSGASYIKQFDAETWPTKFACEVRDFKLPEGAIKEQYKSYINRPSGFGCAAAHEAVRDSGIMGIVDPERFGVSVGASIGSMRPDGLATMLSSDVYKGQIRPSIGEEIKNEVIFKNHPGTLAAVLSSTWDCHGPLTTIHTACASSGQSLGHAYFNIKRGDCDAMIAGGADSLAGELLLAGFCLLGALSTRNDSPIAASRPFDKDRDGFVASEGAAMLILEEMEHALKRGAPIYGEICGYGETESAYRITDLPPNGRGVVEAMHSAVEQSGLDYADIGYINAHGTSTELNDRIEALAVRRVFGSRGVRPMVSSTKSETGHMISAAGALELAFSALSVRDGKVPPSINLNKTDCGDDIDFIANEMRHHPIKAAMSNSIGFGGTNTSIIVKRIDA